LATWTIHSFIPFSFSISKRNIIFRCSISNDCGLLDPVRPRGRYRRQREYPQPPPPTKNNTKITIKIVSIVSPLLGCLFLTLLEHVVCQNLWCEKGCRFRPLLSAYRGTRMKVPSHTSNRSTKRSNLIGERPLTNRRDLIRPDFRGAGNPIHHAPTLRVQCARALHSARETARGLLLQGLRGQVRYCERRSPRESVRRV
jgi:hypothetical protein